jgi:acetoin utilization deacetylase AcuC-like enzyme
VHHGNGTSSIFKKDPNVLYFSAHRWQGGTFFPFLQSGGPSHVGVGEGEGFNINVGWSRKGMGDDEYYAVWEHVLMPVAKEFQPDLVLVSAGFDSAIGDLGECTVTPECFGELTRSLKTLAGGRVVAALEGGYVQSILGKCVTSVVEALLDRTREELNEEEVHIPLDCIDSFAAKNIQSTIDFHKPYWKCLRGEEDILLSTRVRNDVRAD